jgi:hypothetical protein
VITENTATEDVTSCQVIENGDTLAHLIAYMNAPIPKMTMLLIVLTVKTNAVGAITSVGLQQFINSASFCG